MTEKEVLPFGERAVSWLTVWDHLYPEGADCPHDDAAAAEMHRLRGLVMVQNAETEAVLGLIVKRLDPAAVGIEQRTAGQLLKDIRRLLSARSDARWDENLRTVDRAIKRRNDAVHSSVEIGSSWAPYVTGGGEWVPVISLMRGEEYNEINLRADLALQQEATIAAVRLWASL
ncbi:MAG: hypothetical protein JO115_08515 [Pseudonocardiales bacterium]|nr:hypothetical protein [Pseudonocardiales bacterium]